MILNNRFLFLFTSFVLSSSICYAMMEENKGAAVGTQRSGPSQKRGESSSSGGGAPATSASLPVSTRPIQKEPIFLRVPRSAFPFKLPDGSEVTQDQSRVWVKKPDQAYYATSWADYTRAQGLNIEASVVNDFETRVPELRVCRGTPPFKLPDGSEVAHNGNDEFWVKKPGQTYYQTSWADYRTETGIPLQPHLVSRPKGFVELRITRASPLFKFPLPDGSEAHVNANNRVWVQTPSQSYPETRWEDYAYTWKLPIWPTVTAGESDTVEFSIMRGSSSFSLPGGYKIATNSADEVWVQEPGMTHYATPWDKFIEKLGVKATISMTDDKRYCPVPFDAPGKGFVQAGYKGVFKVNQQACRAGFETFAGRTVTPEFLGIENFTTESKKYKHGELPAASTHHHDVVYEVTDQDSYEAAREMMKQGLNPCVSNAANATTPGGGVTHGAQAQEEELCKRSTLYKGLLPRLYPLKDDELLYTPGVTVFMHPGSYSFMEDPYHVAVISQAYICLYDRFTEEKEPEKSAAYRQITSEKIIAHLRLAAMQGHDSVVLAASGCGAFSKGRPGPVSAAVAQLFHDILETQFKGVFKKVRFAILTRGYNSIIYDTFRREFGL